MSKTHTTTAFFGLLASNKWENFSPEAQAIAQEWLEKTPLDKPTTKKVAAVIHTIPEKLARNWLIKDAERVSAYFDTRVTELLVDAPFHIPPSQGAEALQLITCPELAEKYYFLVQQHLEKIELYLAHADTIYKNCFGQLKMIEERRAVLNSWGREFASMKLKQITLGGPHARTA